MYLTRGGTCPGGVPTQGGDVPARGWGGGGENFVAAGNKKIKERHLSEILVKTAFESPYSSVLDVNECLSNPCAHTCLYDCRCERVPEQPLCSHVFV